jgi:predicted GIY-YIG superfamily endonuclease
MDFSIENLLERQKTILLERNGDSLYFIQAKGSGRIKIGRSKNPERRLKTLQTGNASQLKMVCSLNGLGWRERDIHEALKKWRLKGEWFEYECVGSIPNEIYELIPYGGLDDWWG